MKKIVTTTLVVGSQLFIGILFLIMLFSTEESNNTIILAQNDNLNKMTEIVPVFVSSEIIETAIEEKIEENVPEAVVDLPVAKKEALTASTPAEIPAVEEKTTYNVIETYIGKLTGYGPNCIGCSGMTASDYDVRSTTTYLDSEYGEIRIVAADKSIPFYSIIRISNVEGLDPIIAIVLDRGGTVGFDAEKVTTFDLLFASESEANSTIGLRSNVTFELLRSGK